MPAGTVNMVGGSPMSSDLTGLNGAYKESKNLIGCGSLHSILNVLDGSPCNICLDCV